jgi:hypothetical protein
VPVGPEFQLNTYTTTNQRQPSVAVDAAGNFVVVWPSNGSVGSDNGGSGSIQGRRYDGSGTPQDDQFQVNTYTSGHQDYPSVAMDGSGNFVVVWESRAFTGPVSGGDSIRGQRYDSTGLPQSAEFQVNTYATGDQRRPTVASDSAGNCVVVWDSDGSPGSDPSSSIQGRRFDSAGMPQGDQFQVNTYTTDGQRSAAVASDSVGNFVVAWESFGSSESDTSRFSIQGQRFNGTGVPQGSQFQVNTYTTSEQLDPMVASDSNGNFVVVWESLGSSGSDTSSYGVHGQRYDSAGSPQGGQFQVNTYTTSEQLHTAVATDGAGNFVVVWESLGGSGSDPINRSVQGQRYLVPTTTSSSSSTTSTSIALSTTTTLQGTVIPGRIALIKSGIIAKFLAKPDGPGGAFPLPTADPVTEGGTLRFFDFAAGAGDDVYPLASATPPLGWRGLGNPAGSKGYKYKGAGTPSDPCTVVLVKETVIKGICKGSGITVTPPFTGDVGIILSVGMADRYCAQFDDSDEVRNDATLTKRKNAPAPGACP